MRIHALGRAVKARALCLLAALAGLSAQAHAYTHPGIPTRVDDLATIKASLNQEPWKSGYAGLSGDGRSSLNYTMAGPFANVSRAGSYDQYLGAWQNDMIAVYNLSLMSYFTGNAAYAQKARDILIAWANTHTSFSGNESGLAIGDHAYAFGGGASILRGTWSGWTAADTTAVKNYFSNVLWTPSAGWNVQGPANKGAIYMQAGIAIAVFCDDAAKFNQIVNQMRTFHGSGLMNTLPTGQLGESGRNVGHAYGMLNGLAFVSEVAWAQGVDLFSEYDNRLLACGEYFCRNAFTTDNPYVPYGSIDWSWMYNSPGPATGNRSAFYILQNAYKNRKNLPTPWIDRNLEEPAVGNSFMYAKTADTTTATLSPATFPGVSLASSGLTLTTLGSQTSGRSLSYSNGVWTMTGLGNGVWTDGSDDCQFAYRQMTGDCAMVAKVNSFTYSGSNNGKAGLMIRDNLSATVSQRAWVGFVPAATQLMESHMRGWTENWAGGGYDDRSHQLTPYTSGLPYWCKIERRGKQIAVFTSQDGTSWMPMSCSYYGNLPSTLYIGFHLSSGNSTSVTATFSNVAFTGGTGGLVTTPAAPAGLIATASSKAVTARWLPSFGATGYDLLRSTSINSGYTVLASNLTGTSYVDTTAALGTNYYYRVRAKNSAGTSGDSMTFGGSHSQLIPQMAHLAHSGTSTASFNQDSATEGSAKAFDRNPGSKWFCYNSPTGWIQYDFGTSNAQVVKRYTISCADVDTRDPKSWNFRASQDGVSWTWLASASNQTFDYRMQQKVYDIGNTTAYRYYRLEITANNGATGVAVSELGLWGNSGQTVPDGRYRLVSRKSNKVVDLFNGGTADGTDAIQWGWNGGNDQKWNLAYLGNGQYKLTGVASGKLLEVSGASTSNGGIIQIWPSNNNNCQKWTVVPAGDGAFKLINVNSGKIMDVSGGSTADGAVIHQWTDLGADNQQWRFGIVP